MKKALISLLILLIASAGASLIAQNTAALYKAVQELTKDPAMKHGELSVTVYSIEQGKPVFSYNSHRAMMPASLTKMFTTAAGFEKLGSNFRFTTRLAYSGTIDSKGTLHGDLYIIGGGDPLLGSYRYKQTLPDTLFATWSRAISQAGIRAVDGRVRYDGTIFDDKVLHDSWMWGDIGNYYGSGVSGLNFHENMFFIYLNPGSRVGQAAKLSHTAPAGLSLSIINEVKTGAAKSGDQVVVYGDPITSLRTCTGTIPLDAKNMAIRASLPRPGKACADLFTQYLRAHKITVSGASEESLHKPSNLTTIVDITSPTYYVIAQYTNMTSNNTYAEAIYKYLGYKGYNLGNYANGGRVMKDFLSKHGLETAGIVLEDGSGLSKNNRVTTDFVCRFLVEMSRTTYFGDYQKSLALAGQNGTVKNMLSGLSSNVSVRMKSGTLVGLRAFAGYVTTAKGNRYSFAVISSDFDCSGAQMRSKLEKVIMKIAEMD